MSTPAAEPIRIFIDRPGWCVLVAAASVLLTVLAVRLDPVIGSGGVDQLHAARLFATAEWRAGLEAAGRPVHALLVALVSGVTGLSAIHAAHALNAVFHALLVIGFAALAGAFGGGRVAQALAAVTALLYPALNGFRADATGDAAYWALYVWSLAGFLYYAATRDRRGLWTWLLAGFAAVLFAVEMLVFLLIVPAWLLVRSASAGRPRGRRLAAVAAGMAVVLCYALWRQAWDAAPPAMPLDPAAAVAVGWHDLAQALRFKLEGLRNQFLDEYSRDYDAIALVMALSMLCLVALVKALGPVYTVVAGYAAAVSKRSLPDAARCWWAVFAVVAAALLLVPALTRFQVAPRDAMIAALTMLAIVPPALERLWRAGGRGLLAGILLLVAVAGAAGFVPGADEHYRREAGLWLRDHAPPDASLFSNSRVVVYYSGLDRYRPGADYSWQQAMSLVWRDRWREYDYLALEIAGRNAHREGILMRRIDAKPVRTFANDAGDRVLVFASRR